MKMNRIMKWSIPIVGILGLAYLAPIVVWNLKQEPFDGFYHIWNRCGCGHRSFWEISGTNLFAVTPGHRQRELLYSLSQQSNVWHAVRISDNELWFRIRQIEENMEFVRQKNGSVNRYDRVKNPWHLWWPRLMPE